MLSNEHNELLTRTGTGTPMGELIRRYFQMRSGASHIWPRGSRPKPGSVQFVAAMSAISCHREQLSNANAAINFLLAKGRHLRVPNCP